MGDMSSSPELAFNSRLTAERVRLQKTKLLSLGFGGRLKSERERMLLGQQVMADLACVSLSTYKRIERGSAPMDTDALYRLGCAGVDIRLVIFGGEPDAL